MMNFPTVLHVIASPQGFASTEFPRPKHTPGHTTVIHSYRNYKCIVEAVVIHTCSKALATPEHGVNKL
jgi:hypothetical protein